jgi:type II secretory pathway component PulK
MRRRGSAILAVLIMVALAGGLLAVLMEESSLELVLGSQEADRARLRAEAWSELELALAVINEVRTVDRGRLHAPEQGWGDPRDYLGEPARPGLEVSYEFTVENGKLPLPALSERELTDLLRALGQDDAEAANLADAMLGWMKPGREAEDDRADDQAYDQAVIPYRSPGRSLRSFEELRAIGVAKEAFFDELGRPTALLEGFRRCVSLHDFPAVSVNFAEPEALQAVGFSSQGIARARAHRADPSTRATGMAPYFRNREECLEALGGGNAARATSLIYLLRIRVTVREGQSSCTVGALVALDNAVGFPAAVPQADAEEAQANASAGAQGRRNPQGRTATLSNFPILEWEETGAPPRVSEIAPATVVRVKSGEGIPPYPALDKPPADLNPSLTPARPTGRR